VAYTAPEVYMEGSYSTKSDIYSVGFVIWELALRIVKGTQHCVVWAVALALR
jgi:serine/threonine protein kinase